MSVFSDTKHLWILAALVTLGVAAAVTARGLMVPKTYGEHEGHFYRQAALEQIASRPSVHIADSVCHECHQDVKEERAEAKHHTVGCFHCHGPSKGHVADARAKADSKEATKPATKLEEYLKGGDFFITQDRESCVKCHEEGLGMPSGFQKINVAEHLDDEGADEPDSRETCFECHDNGHDTTP